MKLSDSIVGMYQILALSGLHPAIFGKSCKVWLPQNFLTAFANLVDFSTSTVLADCLQLKVMKQVLVCCSDGSRKKIFGGPGPSSFGRQQRLSKIYYRTN